MNSIKEEAVRLVGLFAPLVTSWDCYHDRPLHPEEMLPDQKKCALICVDEILNVLNTANVNPYYAVKDREHYQQLKQEIEKL